MKRAIMLALWIALAWTNAHAQSFRGDEASCEHLAGFVGQVTTELRDTGAPWQAFEQWMRGQVEEAAQNPQTYVKGEVDVEYIMAAFKRVWDNPKMSAEQLEAVTRSDCMKKAGKVAARGGGKPKKA